MDKLFELFKEYSRLKDLHLPQMVVNEDYSGGIYIYDVVGEEEVFSFGVDLEKNIENLQKEIDKLKNEKT